jgi:hypothetical protein
VSKEVKVILIVIGSLAALVFLVCVGGAVFFVMTIAHQVGATDPASKARTAAKIATFELPPGYQYLMAMDMGFMDMVVIAPQGSVRGAFLIELQGIATPTIGESDDQIIASMQQSLGRSSRCSGTTTIGNDSIETAAGKTIVLRAIDCNSGSAAGSTIEFGHIPSKYPLGMIMAIGSPQTFDRRAVHELVRSLR